MAVRLGQATRVQTHESITADERATEVASPPPWLSSGFPPGPCPEAQGLPSSSKCFVARFPSSLLGLRRPKSLPAPPSVASKCPTWDGEVKTANHASANHRKIASAATRPKGAWTSIRILLRAWGAPSDPWRCHLSGLGPLPSDQRQEFMLPIKVRTKVKEPGNREPWIPPGIHRDWLSYEF